MSLEPQVLPVRTPTATTGVTGTTVDQVYPDTTLTASQIQQVGITTDVSGGGSEKVSYNQGTLTVPCKACYRSVFGLTGAGSSRWSSPGRLPVEMSSQQIIVHFIYYEQQIKRELKRIHISGCRCNERLKAKTDGSKSLGYTGFRGDLEHLTIETRLVSESFECVMGECVI